MNDGLNGFSAHISDRYVSIPNGLKMCWGAVNITTTAQSNGAYPFAGNVSINFPSSFTDTPVIITNVLDHSSWWSSSAYGISLNGSTIALGGDSNNTTKIVQWVAIGR